MTVDTFTLNGRRRRAAPFVPDPLLTAREAAEYRRQGLSTFWRDVARGTAPKPVYVSPGAPRWRLSELDAAIAAGRPQAPRGAK